MKKVLVVVLLFSVFVFSPVQAEDKKDGDAIVTMEEIVVTATKIPEKRKDIPNAVIIIDKKDIQTSGAKSIGELLANEPGVEWKTYGNYAEIGRAHV